MNKITTKLENGAISFWQDGENITAEWEFWLTHTINNPIFSYDGIEDLVEWIERKHNINIELGEYFNDTNFEG